MVFILSGENSRSDGGTPLRDNTAFPGPNWYEEWTFVQSRLDESEIAILNDAHKKVVEAFDAVLAVHTLLLQHGSQEEPGAMSDATDQMDEFLDASRLTMHRLCEMIEDPYKIAEKQKKRQKELDERIQQLES